MSRAVYKFCFLPKYLLDLPIWLLAWYTGVVNCLNCAQRTSCSCEMSDGSGIIDLHPVSKSGVPAFKVKVDNVQYMFNPCSSFSVKDSDQCKNVILCADRGQSCQSLGRKQNVKFNYVNKSAVMQLTENGTDTSIWLICRHGNSASDFSAKQINNTVYNMTFTSQSACVQIPPGPSGLSPGTILIIITLSVATIYMGVGSLYNKTVNNATSAEDVIPHYDFWTDLPYLVRDGYRYFLSPCIGATKHAEDYAYQSI